MAEVWTVSTSIGHDMERDTENRLLHTDTVDLKHVLIEYTCWVWLGRALRMGFCNTVNHYNVESSLDH